MNPSAFNPTDMNSAISTIQTAASTLQKAPGVPLEQPLVTKLRAAFEYVKTNMSHLESANQYRLKNILTIIETNLPHTESEKKIAASDIVGRMNQIASQCNLFLKKEKTEKEHATGTTTATAAKPLPPPILSEAPPSPKHEPTKTASTTIIDSGPRLSQEEEAKYFLTRANPDLVVLFNQPDLSPQATALVYLIAQLDVLNPNFRHTSVPEKELYEWQNKTYTTLTNRLQQLDKIDCDAETKVRISGIISDMENILEEMIQENSQLTRENALKMQKLRKGITSPSTATILSKNNKESSEIKGTKKAELQESMSLHKDYEQTFDLLDNVKFQLQRIRDLI